jgi:hypothetical protein
MNAELVDRIVKAVLYEGYMLYPYRPSSVKNQQRFNFGVLYPRAYGEAQHGSDACCMQTECLVQGSEETHCTVRVRFLRMISRSIGKPRPSSDNLLIRTSAGFEKVDQLQIGGKTYRPWQEAAEETIELGEFSLPELLAQPSQRPFCLEARQEKEEIRDGHGELMGLIEREKRTLAGTIRLSAELLAPCLYKLRIQIANETCIDTANLQNRELALEYSLVSTHTILEARNGNFVSLIDPSVELSAYAAQCQNVGAWPILIGNDGERDTLLCSPIILYDYPETAPESPGDLFDGAEIDEILSLRIMTLTDDEKREMRESDNRARQILERTESLPEEQWMKLHGALRGLRAVKGDMP